MIVADTHAFLWWLAEDDRLSMKARETMDTNPVRVAAITCFEIVRLVERGRFRLAVDVRTWLENVFTSPKVALLAMTMEVAIVAGKLQDPISDPIDRIIVATALLDGVALVTKDHKIIATGIVPTIW
ncbi:MAG TPA: type II toxin-antitoxin system VapC family toxin [Thermoanaerobaculia bacterium]